MQKKDDPISKKISEILSSADTPLETREIELGLKGITRIKVFYRLLTMRGDGAIMGKMIGSGKGTWIWWRNGVFER